MMQKVVGIPRRGQLRRWGIADVGEGKGGGSIGRRSGRRRVEHAKERGMNKKYFAKI